MQGYQETRTLAAAAAKGATKVVLSAAFTWDVLDGDTLIIAGIPVRTTAYCEAGVLNTPVVPLASALASGATGVLSTPPGSTSART